MRMPSFVTFTGIDARTDLQRAMELSRIYPIEWGILYGNSAGPRYMEPWRRLAISKLPMRKAAHLCGRFAQAFQNGANALNLTGYDRIQINMQDKDYQRAKLASLDGLVPGFCPEPGRLIMQFRGSQFPTDSTLAYLYDKSGGRGKTSIAYPTINPMINWPTLVGYAGGIKPDNIDETIKCIAPARAYWLDMETGIRTDDWLDLDKCQAVCEKLWPERVGIEF